MKTIGNALGHRDIESAFVYLRLDVDDLREVGAGNTIFGGTNLSDLPRKEWNGLPQGLETWEFFNTVTA
jgi:hypothetical protein